MICQISYKKIVSSLTISSEEQNCHRLADALDKVETIILLEGEKKHKRSQAGTLCVTKSIWVATFCSNFFDILITFHMHFSADFARQL